MFWQAVLLQSDSIVWMQMFNYRLGLWFSSIND